MSIDLKKYLSQVLDRLTAPIENHSIQLFINSDPGDEQHPPHPIGSGVLLKHNQNHYIATAAHVIESRNTDHIGVYTRVKDFFELGNTCSTQETSPSPVFDVAIWYIEPDIAKDIAPEEWWYDISQSVFRHQESQEIRYYIYGFPGKKYKINHQTKAIIQYPFRFFTRGFSTHHHGRRAQFNPQYHLLLEFHKKKVADVRTGKRHAAPKPFGMSGCGLWFFDGQTYRLAGIMTEWKQQTERIPALRATKIDIVLDAINYIETGLGIQ